MTRPVDTDEQLSGRAAAAVADMQGELSRRYSGLNTAEAQLAEALLGAHATSEGGRQRLQDIQRQLVEAIVNPVNALDTPAGERQFLMFLRAKVAEIQRIVDDGALTAADRADVTRALASGYLADDPVPAAAPAAAGGSPAPPPAPSVPAAGMGAMPSLGGMPSVPAGAAPGAGALGTASPLAGLSSLLDGREGTHRSHDPGPGDEEAPRDDRDDPHHKDRDGHDRGDDPDTADPRENSTPDDDEPAQTRPEAS